MAPKPPSDKPRRKREPDPTPETDPVPTRQEAHDDFLDAAHQLAGLPLITRRQICALTNTSLTAWDTYVSRHLAPQPVGFHPRTGAKLWDRDAVEQWDTDRVRYAPRKTKTAPATDR